MNLRINPLTFGGCREIVPEVFEDGRGFLARIYDERIFKEAGLPTAWTEESHHHTSRACTLRGLYVQRPPYGEGKLLRAIRGEMQWVFVDVRAGSPTFGQWDSIILSAQKKNMLYTPRGFAHGCLSLSDGVDLLIRSDNFFSAEHGFGIRFDDPDLAVKWQLGGTAPLVSDRDRNYPPFREFQKAYTEALKHP